MTTNDDDNQQLLLHAQMGRAALIPGVQYVLDRIQRELDHLRAQLATAQSDLGMAPRRRGPGRPQKAAKVMKAVKSGWSDNPAERKREMARRMKVAARKRAKGEAKASHPREAGHPDHAKFLAKSKRAQKKYWAGLTVAQRKARVAKMLAGKKPVVPEVRLAAAS